MVEDVGIRVNHENDVTYVMVMKNTLSNLKGLRCKEGRGSSRVKDNIGIGGN